VLQRAFARVMTHSSIVSHLYSDFSRYRELWNRKLDETEEFGAFVFLPGKDLRWEWWSVLKIRDYIRGGGLDDEEVLDGLKNFDFGKEFLVLVIEHVDGPKKQEAHFHRMNKVGMN
jgi:hypothetical protein